MKKIIFLIIILLSDYSLQNLSKCSDADFYQSNSDLCPIKTSSGENCQIPFVLDGKEYNYCIINYPNSRNDEYVPKCMTSSGAWSACILPTDAVVDFVTTRKNGGNWVNTVSRNGGTMIWIYGKRFAQNLFAFAPTEDYSNQVIITNEFNSYDCPIHTDKVTATQITCYAPAMPEGTYTVRVKVNGNLIPLEQYINIENADITVADWTTPKLTAVEPISAPPGSMVTLRGNFRTLCYTRDEDECADDAGARISRIYFNGQLCNLINPETNLVYQNLTTSTLVCKLEGHEVNVYNATVLVSEQYGRSLTSPSIFYISADEQIYNFESYAEIVNVNYQNASINGGLKLRIMGNHFYSDENLKANLKIGNEECRLIGFTQNNFYDSIVECEVPADPGYNRTYFYGGRGVNLIVDYVETSFENLASQSPSMLAVKSVTDKMSVSFDFANPVTVWFIGYFAPLKSGSYDFTINTNGYATVYLSSNENPNDKTVVSTYRSNYVDYSKVNLEAGKYYFIEAIGSSSSSSFKLEINGRFYDTKLVDSVTSNVKNEIQEIEIRSQETKEEFIIDYTNVTLKTAVSEVQRLTINSSFSVPYVLSFENVETILLDFDTSSALNLQDALNDLPSLGSNLVSVSPVSSNNPQIKIFRVTFSADLGDVPNLEEKSGNLLMKVEEETKGVASGENVQFNIQGQNSPLFSLTQTTDELKDVLKKTFGIRCPASIIDKTIDVHEIYDFETCGSIPEGDLNQTAFCGLCSSKNSYLFTNAKAFSIFKYLCFAYKQNVPFYRIDLQYRDYGGAYYYRSVEVDSIADGKWHFTCIDIVTNIADNIGSFLIYRALLYPFSSETSYVDAVSLRKALPTGYDDLRLISTRRLFPNIPIIPNQLEISSNVAEKKFTLKYKPNNCLYNLSDISVRNFPQASVIRLNAANPPVTGSFNLSWNGKDFNEIAANIDDISLKNYLETNREMGQVTIERSKNCAGYKWRIKWQSGGRKPDLIIVSNSLNGNSPIILERKIQTGHALFAPLTDNILRSFHQNPQITVTINGITSKCLGSCTFAWSNDSTPLLESIDTSIPNAISLNGYGFDPIQENNLVLIGDTKCDVFSASENRLECTPNDGPLGSFSFSLNVLGKGLATLSSLAANVRFTFELDAFQVSPTFSGTGGGVIANITGKGFSSKTSVSIDGNNCPIIFFNYTIISCMIPPNPTNQSNKVVDIVLTDGDQIKTLNNSFMYDFENTHQVTSISKTKLSVLGDEIITIEGTFFQENIQVYIGSKLANVVSSNNGTVVIKTPSNEPGIYPLIIPIDSFGNAKSDQLFEYVFYVSSFEPRLSSKSGGSVITVYGDGFNANNCESNKVSFERYSCRVINCTENWITCETEPTHTVYHITNNGLNPKWGKGYAWDHSYLEIDIGDSVNWSWKPVNTVAGLKFMVQQLKNPTGIEPEGFWSGPATETGSFTFQFNIPGTYYYWSGFIEQSKVVSFNGVIVVLDKNEEKDLEIEVTQNEIKALKCNFPFSYKSNLFTNCTNEDESFDWCSPSENADFYPVRLPCDPLSSIFKPNCSSQQIDETECGHVPKNKMRFTNCSVPKIESVWPYYFSYETEINIYGMDFSSSECENEAYIGGRVCSIIYANSTLIKCFIGRNSGLEPFQNHSVEVKVKNKGYALKMDNFIFVNFVTVATEVSPSVGSTNGGAMVTLIGDGFDQSTTVRLADALYDSSNSLIMFDSFIFITQPNTGEYTLTISTNGFEVNSNISLTYEFSTEANPQITSLSTTEIDQETNITVQGINFGSDPSQIDLKIGNQICKVINATDVTILCTLRGLEVGAHSVALNIKEIGNSDIYDQKIIGNPTVKSIEPSTGSINGGTIVKIIGNGFSDETSIQLGSSSCTVQKYEINLIECETQAGQAQVANLTVITSNIEHSNDEDVSFTFSFNSTPVIYDINPKEENFSSSILVLTGENFSNDISQVHVKIDESECKVISASLTEVACILGENGAGTYPIELKIDSFGYANKDVLFSYNLNIHNLSSNEGSLAGGLVLGINGSGFSQETGVFICNNECKSVNMSSSEIYCIVPSSDSTIDKNCTIEIIQNDIRVQANFFYKESLTPKLFSSFPKRGGTGGGTLLTLTGEKFIDGLTKVEIANTPCQIITINSTSIVCRTGPFPFSSTKAIIQIYIDQVGIAMNEDNFFEYIDLWSSKYTWGGLDPPGEGEVVVISENQVVFFDTQTPVLKGIIIIGGALIFDDTQDVHLKCEYIIIIDNGVLQIGTEDKPFMHQAEITMYGSARSIEIPIFGAKVIAVRNGTIDMHGKPVGVTWTQLDQTANSGSNQIVLKEPVIWEVGNEIVIATTGDLFSVKESEVRTIIGISDDNRTLTLDSQLKFTHLSVEIEVGENSDLYKIEKKAEVGLLTRNIKFKGNNDESWNSYKSADACPEGFNPSEFATQTCFLGRYGDEIGSNEFGAHIMIHADMDAPRNKEHVVARIQNVELYHVGQSFRIGRYPIHFHLNGDMPSSYVRECSIRKSFNRAVNVHGTNYVKVSRNFIYDIMGGAYFLEDSVEIGNEFSYNLAIFVKSSSSLLNEDSTPAAYWITNPNNTVIHNSVAGGTHFGYWYRFLDRPDGPSFNQNYCPKKIPLGRFFNNTIHSSGRIGLWIFPGYTPSISGSCWDSRPAVAKFENLISYSNEKGCEWVFSNSLQFRNFLIYDQYHVGIETKNNVLHSRLASSISSLVRTFYDENTGTAVINSVIIGNSNGEANRSITDSGLVLAWDRGQLIKNVTFINFPSDWSHAMRGPEIIGTCVVFCGGWLTKFENLKFVNVQIRAIHRWDWDLIYDDVDGSLTDESNAVVVYNNNFTNSNTNCRVDSRFINGTICTNSKKWIRFAFNELQPDLVLRANITNINGQMASTVKYAKRLTHVLGFMSALEANQEYLIEFDQALYPTNVSYSAGIYNIEPGDWIIIKHRMWKKPDRVYFGNNLQIESFVPLTSDMDAGRWYWNNATQTLSYILNNNKNIMPFTDYQITFDAHVCRYVGCEPPIQPGYRLPVKERPANALFWSNVETWAFAEPGWGGHVESRINGRAYQLPQEGESVKIPDGRYVVVDCPIPKLKYLQIEGVLEFDNGLNHTINTELIFINGGQLIIGWENDPIKTNVDIILRGTKKSLDFYLPNGISNIGGKGIGVYGGLDLHGRPRNPSWTTLSESVFKNSTQINLTIPVDWQIGELVVIGSTSYHPNQTEILRITSKSTDNRTLTFNSSFKFDHLSFEERYPNGESYRIAAPVGLLSRNIRIIGEEYTNQFADLYGTRTLVSDYSKFDSEGNAVYYKGYARISDVEFELFGQFSRGDSDDYKYGILFSNLGDYNYSRPSYVRNSAFHHGFAAAIGILNSNSIPIEDNVVHRTLDFGFYLEGHSNVIKRNMLVYILWSSSILFWEAEFNGEYWGAIDAHLAESVVIEDNFISGVERLGLFYKAQACDNLNETVGIGKNNSIKGNTIYSSLAGVVILPDFYYENLTCVKISGFTVYKAMHYGIYYQGPQSVILESNKLVDNFIGAFTFVIKPPPILHQISNKFYTNKNSLIVGQSAGFNCQSDVRTFDLNYNSAIRIQTFGSGKDELGRIGLVWSNFIGATNMAPYKPWAGIKTYQSVDGTTLFDNLTIVNFNAECGFRNYFLSTNKDNDDGQHPVMIRNVHMFGVDNSSKVWIHRPNLNKINIWDCIDMDCDALKKALLNDLDGSFLGKPGSVIPQSEFEWGSQQRGLGDFRIPKEMLAAKNGSMIPPDQVYKYPGIIRDENSCEYMSDWQAYKCHDIEHRILIIESMDPDTLKRRLSPVAIFANKTYLDLINGPQDHGCCFGYTCLERLSTFMAIIASNMDIDIYLTSLPPNQLRFRILNADGNYKVRLSMHYFTSNRIDLYKNDRFVPPTNAEYQNGNMILKDTTGNIDKYMPHYINESGTNLAVREDSKVYFTLAGGDYIDLKVTPTIFVRFGVPAITESSFFDKETIVQNFADLLGIPANKIRRVQIVAESPELRKRRSTDMSFIILTIMDNPIDSIDKKDLDESIKNEMLNISSMIMDQFTTGDLQSRAQRLHNITLSSLYVQKPNSNGTDSEIKKISRILIEQDADECQEMVACKIQPILRIVDENNDLLVNMDNEEFSWIIEAEIFDENNTTVKIAIQSESRLEADGFVRFEKLGISQIATNIRIVYRIRKPQTLIGSNFTPPFIESNKLINASKAFFSCLLDQTNMVVGVNEYFNLSISVIDDFFSLPVKNLPMRNFTWQAYIEIFQQNRCQPEGFINTPTAYFSNGVIYFENLMLNATGMYRFNISVKTTNNEYSFYCITKSVIVSKDQTYLDNTTIPSSYFTFNGNFNDYKDVTEDIKNIMYNCYIEEFNLILKTPISVYEGSVMVNFDYSGTPDEMTLFGQNVSEGFEIFPGLSLSLATLNDIEIGVRSSGASTDHTEQSSGHVTTDISFSESTSIEQTGSSISLTSQFTENLMDTTSTNIDQSTNSELSTSEFSQSESTDTFTSEIMDSTFKNTSDTFTDQYTSNSISTESEEIDNTTIIITYLNENSTETNNESNSSSTYFTASSTSTYESNLTNTTTSFVFTTSNGIGSVFSISNYFLQTLVILSLLLVY